MNTNTNIAMTDVAVNTNIIMTTTNTIMTIATMTIVPADMTTTAIPAPAMAEKKATKSKKNF